MSNETFYTIPVYVMKEVFHYLYININAFCSKSNDTLKCIISRTTEECGADAASYVQQYVDTSMAPLKSFFACSDEVDGMYILTTNLILMNEEVNKHEYLVTSTCSSSNEVDVPFVFCRYLF